MRLEWEALVQEEDRAAARWSSGPCVRRQLTVRIVPSRTVTFEYLNLPNVRSCRESG
jgi:hypothetical protein